MSFLVPLALYGWIPITLLVFAAMPARKALLLTMLAGWLLLPVARLKLPGLPDIDKIAVVNGSCLLGALVFDSRKVLGFRLRAVDLPVLLWILCPWATSLSNGLGAYDGASQSLTNFLAWGIPWLLGRCYFDRPAQLEQLARAMVVAGALYVPLILWEVRMSPNLHLKLYGFVQQSWIDMLRWGGFRPVVFLNQGLMVAMWMSLTTLVGYTLHRAGKLPRIGAFPAGPVLALMALTTVLCKTLAAILFLLGGVLIVNFVSRSRLVLPVMLLALAPSVYVVLRLSNALDNEALVELVTPLSAERADSFGLRLKAESILVERTRERPLFGWGGWGRNTTEWNDEFTNEVVLDGLWLIAFSKYGLVGLTALLATLAVPVVSLLLRRRLAMPFDGAGTAAGALALVLALFSVDTLLNDNLQPIFLLAGGGLATLGLQLAARRAPASRPRPQPAPLELRSVRWL